MGLVAYSLGAYHWNLAPLIWGRAISQPSDLESWGAPIRASGTHKGALNMDPVWQQPHEALMYVRLL